MKYVLFLLVFGFANAATAQDYCKLVKKEVTDNNTSYSYESPYKEDSLPTLRVSRNYSTNPEYEFDNFSLTMTIPCEFQDLLVKGANGSESEREETKVVITFQDNSKLEDESLQIMHDKKGDGSAMRSAVFPITAEHIKDLTTKKIVKIQLATATQNVPESLAVPIMQYIICMKNVRKLN